MAVYRIGIADVKRHFADVLGAVRHRGDRFVIERRGTPVAALVPLDVLEQADKQENQGFLALVGGVERGEDIAAALDDAIRERRRAGTRPAPTVDG